MLYVLQTALAGKLGHTAAIYMDDALLHSRTWKEHISTTEVLLKTLQTNNLTANPKKCEWGYQNVTFLGYQLGTKGVKMDPRRIRIIEKLSPPSNPKGLQRLLGLFVYWRRFIKQFSSHTFYVRQLLKEDVDFCWTPECDQELQYLKCCLMSEPILANIDPNKILS